MSPAWARLVLWLRPGPTLAMLLVGKSLPLPEPQQQVGACGTGGDYVKHCVLNKHEVEAWL